MFQTMNVLQLGGDDCSKIYDLPDGMTWFYEPDLTMVGRQIRQGKPGEDVIVPTEEELQLSKIRQFDAAIVARPLTREECHQINRKVSAYSLFVCDTAPIDSEMQSLLQCRCGEVISPDDLEDLIQNRLSNYYSGSYGEKSQRQHFLPTNVKKKKIEYSGYRGILIEGNFGNAFEQTGYWKTNIPLFPDETLELWVEFEKDAGVTIELDVYCFPSGSVENIMGTWTFSEDQITSKKWLSIQNTYGKKANLFVSLKAKGAGKLRIIDLHNRWSRNGIGEFLPGGERMVTKTREEAFFYFEPGDRRPPLNVYFSGYRTKEGFEAYRMMRSLGSPFLLVSDPRLEGGSFYMGSEEYESGIKNRILQAMHDLQFTEKDLIFTGLSMGTTGAMYYAAKIAPAYVIIGKPLASLGSIAEAERIDRPGGFPTSLDVLGKLEGNLLPEDAKRLNERFWHVFRFGDWSKTTFIVAYMIEDDYDGTAYARLLESLTRVGTRVIGKGLHGRHNDDTAGIVRWYLKQYKEVLEHIYKRKLDEDA